MNIEIRKLAPDLAEKYAHFFDVTPHWDDMSKNELPCYCVTWRSDRSYAGDGDHWYPTREERRERAIRFIRDGSLQGYLAYLGDRVVGWCNATAECKGGVEHLRSYWPIEEHPADVKVMSIFCFMVAPDAQRLGVATKLTKRICMDAAADGYDFVEAYANIEFVAPDCKGPLAMYERCGFIRHSERDGRVVVRKMLK